MDYFWESSGSIPKGNGFSFFDATHLFWLALFFLTCAILLPLYRKAREKGRKRFRIVIASFIFADELGKWVMLLSTGLFTENYLPFQLCTINIFVIAIYLVKPNKLLADFLYAVCLPGALLALVTPSWTKLPLLNFMHIHSFTIHILLALFPLLLVAGGEVAPRFRDAWKFFSVLILLGIPALIVNLTLDTNYMFLCDHDGTVLKVFEDLFGSHLWGFPIILVILWGIMFTPFEIMAYRAKKKKAKAS